MTLCLPKTYDVIPAKAGIHVRQSVAATVLRMGSRMDSGLRRNDPVAGGRS